MNKLDRYDSEKLVRAKLLINEVSKVKDIIEPEQMYAIRKTLTITPTIIEADNTESKGREHL